MFVVGLTGGIGSGKSTAADMFAALGVPVIDTDAIAHTLTAPGSALLPTIAATLGKDILRPDGTLDRAIVRRRIFSDPETRGRLEQLLHPPIRERVEALLQLASDASYRLIVVPLLFETSAYNHLINRSLVIDCDEARQIARAAQRSGLTEAEVRAIMAAQLPRTRRRELADDILDNSGDLDALRAQVLAMHRRYLALAQKTQE